MLVTGAYLSLQVPFPTQAKGLVSLFSPLTEQPKLFKSMPIADQAPIGIGQAVSIANRIFPDGGYYYGLLTCWRQWRFQNPQTPG